MKQLTRKLKKISLITRNSGYRHALLYGVAAAIEHESLLKSLKCKIVIDVGANRGQFALVSRRCFPDARIESFEPLTAPANIFRKVFASDGLTRLHQVAIGPDTGKAVIHVSHRDDSSSLLPISDLQNALFPGTAERTTDVIQTEPLHVLVKPEDIESPALLKLDVQGYEIPALEGCKQLLSCFKYVYVECSFVELYSGQALSYQVIAFLAEHSFILQGVYNVSYDHTGIAVQADFFFVKKSAGAVT